MPGQCLNGLHIDTGFDQHVDVGHAQRVEVELAGLRRLRNLRPGQVHVHGGRRRLGHIKKGIVGAMQLGAAPLESKAVLLLGVPSLGVGDQTLEERLGERLEAILAILGPVRLQNHTVPPGVEMIGRQIIKLIPSESRADRCFEQQVEMGRKARPEGCEFLHVHDPTFDLLFRIQTAKALKAADFPDPLHAGYGDDRKTLSGAAVDGANRGADDCLNRIIRNRLAGKVPVNAAK